MSGKEEPSLRDFGEEPGKCRAAGSGAGTADAGGPGAREGKEAGAAEGGAGSAEVT